MNIFFRKRENFKRLLNKIYWELIFAFVMAGHKTRFRGHSIFNISDILPDYIINIQCRNIRFDPCDR